jgi:tetratricopeptide (TPR) repeat protein
LGDAFALAVVSGDYDAFSVFEALYQAVDRDRAARELLKRERERMLHGPEELQRVLVDLLTGPCAQKTADGRPVLLVIDDLERILDAHANGGKHTVKAAALPVMRAVLRAFDPQETDSRLLLTSRYTFALTDSVRDLAAKLYELQLPPLSEGAQRKLTLRMEQWAGSQAGLSEAEVAARRRLLDRAQAVARGNPGLQHLLAALVLAPGAEAAQVERTLAEMEAYFAQGNLPHMERVRSFLVDMALNQLGGLASGSARELLGRATLFEVPVPVDILAHLGDRSLADVLQLQALGLLDRFEDPIDPHRPAAGVNALVRPKAGKLLSGERAEHAARVLPALFQAWGGAARRYQRPHIADLKLTRLGLLADNPEVLEACAAHAVRGLQSSFAYRQAAALGQQVIEVMDRAGRPPPLELLRLTGEICLTVGEVETTEVLYGRGIQAIEAAKAAGKAVDPLEEGTLFFAHAQRLTQRGESYAALAFFERAREIAQRLHRPKSLAIVVGEIARLRAERGEIAQALAMLREEAEVYQASGDLHGTAIVLADIARLCAQRGEVAQALEMHQQRLQVYQALGDRREQAIALGDIARLLAQRGEVDQALEMHQQRLAVFQTLGDRREQAIALGDIARLYEQRGGVDQALAIQEQVLKGYQRLGDRRSAAIALGDIARLRAQRGEVDQALEMHQQRLAVFQAVGDRRSAAIALGDIAPLRAAKGEIDQALAIHEQVLEVYQALGDQRSVAIALGDIARLRSQRGEVDQALKMHQQRLEVVQTLGDQGEIAAAIWDIAQIELARQNLPKAVPRILEAYDIATHIEWLGGVCVIGQTLGQLLVAADERDRGLTMLRRSADGYRQLGRLGYAEKVEAIIRELEATPDRSVRDD